MKRLILFLLTAATVFAADDPWDKVKALKSGTEIRVVKKGAAQPLIGKFDEARDDSLVMVLKTEQIAVAKEDIDRVDYRPAGARVTTETKTTTEDPQRAKEPRAGMNGQEPGSSSSTSTNFGIHGKPDFEVLYRRPTSKRKTSGRE